MTKVTNNEVDKARRITEEVYELPHATTARLAGIDGRMDHAG